MIVSAPTTKLQKLRPFAAPVVLVLLAEGWFRAGDWSSESFPAPSEMAREWTASMLDGSLWTVTLQTLLAAGGGLAIGASIGLSLGLAFGLIPPLNRLINLSIECFRPIPSIGLLPVVMMVYGLGYRLEIALVAFATSWPMMLFGRSAVLSVHPRLIDVGQIMGFSAPARLWKIVLPAALPVIFVGFRLSVGMALVVAVTVEIAANPLGLGNAMMIAEQSFHPSLMFSLILWTGAVGSGLNGLLGVAERKLFANSLRGEASP